MDTTESKEHEKFAVLTKRVKNALNGDPEYIQLKTETREIANRISRLKREKEELENKGEDLELKLCDLTRRIIFNVIDDPKAAKLVARFYQSSNTF